MGQIKSYREERGRSKSPQIIGKGGFVYGNKPYITYSCRKQARSKGICWKKLRARRACISRLPTVLGNCIFRTVSMPVVVLQLNQLLLILRQYPGTGEILPYKKRNPQPPFLTTSHMHHQLASKAWIRFRRYQLAFISLSTMRREQVPKLLGRGLHLGKGKGGSANRKQE